MRQLPGLFRPLVGHAGGTAGCISATPQDLFELQVENNARYHMTEAQVFYNNEDLWQVPKERYWRQHGRRWSPTTCWCACPGESRLEFMLMMPMTPVNRDNMIGWMAARCDPDHLGQIVVFSLPKERLVLGPAQIEATIDQDTTISRQLSLWDQRGSRVVRGNLLVIPVDDGFLYVEPVYLAPRATNPQLKRVIVSDGNSRRDGGDAGRERSERSSGAALGGPRPGRRAPAGRLGIAAPCRERQGSASTRPGGPRAKATGPVRPGHAARRAGSGS